MRPEKEDGYWIKPRARFYLHILAPEGEESEHKGSWRDTADTPDEEEITLVDLDLHLTEYPPALLLKRLDAIRKRRTISS